MRLKLIPLALALCAISTQAADNPLQVLSRSSNDFGRNLFVKLSETHSGKNLVYSPLCTFIALSMLEHGAGGKTAELLRQSLHLPEDKLFVDQGIQRIVKTLNPGVKDVTLKLANKIFISDKFNIKTKFLELTQDVFKSMAETLDVAEAVNGWVGKKTQQKISSVIDANLDKNDTSVLLVSAFYFKAQWADQFEKHWYTTFFTSADTSVNVPFFYIEETYKVGFIPSLKARFIRVPYKNRNFEMVIILPNETDGLSELEKQLQSFDYELLNTSGDDTVVKLVMPKFKIENNFDLEEPLKQHDLADLFESPNLSGISDEVLKVSRVVQKAFIDISEEGTGAADATATHDVSESASTSSLPPIEIRVNRPFHFVIRKSLTVLFQGHVYDPSQ